MNKDDKKIGWPTPVLRWLKVKKPDWSYEMKLQQWFDLYESPETEGKGEWRDIEIVEN